jgi:Uncharacterized conserved protein, possibly involved in methylthioadenosine recycling
MNLSQVVQREIQRSPFILEALEAGIVNTTSLARWMQPAVKRILGPDITLSAIAMSIKRAPLSEHLLLEKTISKFMKNLGDITIRSDLSEYSYKASETLLKAQSELLDLMMKSENQFYSFIKGVDETTIVISSSMEPYIEKIFVNQYLLLRRDNLAAISINLPHINLDTHGIYYTIFKKLAWQGINLVEVISTSHEITLVMAEKDVEQAFTIILDLKRS